MKKILVINCSAKKENSYSRGLTEVFTNIWTNTHREEIITFRELGNVDIPHITDQWISAAFKPKAARSEKEIESLKLSDSYIAELQHADIILLATPMYNWSIPSCLKAYIDQIVRINETWKINSADYNNPYIGLLKNKTVYLLLARGAQGYEKGECNEHLNYQSTYLKTVFNIIGVNNIHTITIERPINNEEELKKVVETTHEKLRDWARIELSSMAVFN